MNDGSSTCKAIYIGLSRTTVGVVVLAYGLFGGKVIYLSEWVL